MPVPKQRHTKSRRNRRRSHHALKKRTFSVCAKCGAPVLSHRLCSNCGTYGGREVIDVMAKLSKKEQKKKTKELADQEKPARYASRSDADGGQAENKDLNMEELSKK